MNDELNLDNMIEEAERKAKIIEEEYHGYRGSIARLKDGRNGKILDGQGLKLYLQDVDGGVFECYHDELESIFTP